MSESIRPYYGVRCPACGHTESSTIDTRRSDGFNRRRRECECGERFTTHERVVGESSYRLSALVLADLEHTVERVFGP